MINFLVYLYIFFQFRGDIGREWVCVWKWDT